MSRRRVSDADRTATMVDLVRELYPPREPSLSHVVIEEAAPATGWSGYNRYADVLVLSVWPSKGQTLTGYEIKASKADLKRELADAAKHVALARYCVEWWLVAWDEGVLVDGIPADWGIKLTEPTEHGGRALVTHRKAAKRAPEPWPPSLVCAMVRNAYVQSPGVAYVERIAAQARSSGRYEGERAAAAAEHARLEPLATLLHGADRWKWPAEARDPDALIATAVERLTQGILCHEP